MDPALFWLAALTAMLGFAAYSDIRWRRLPNWLALGLLVVGLGHALAEGGLTQMGWHAAHAGIALVAGIALFATGGFGGGDAKFYAGTAAWFGLSDGLALLLWVSLVAIVTILGWMLVRRRLVAQGNARDGLYARFPYGVAIAIGATGLAWTSALGV